MFRPGTNVQLCDQEHLKSMFSSTVTTYRVCLRTHVSTFLSVYGHNLSSGHCCFYSRCPVCSVTKFCVTKMLVHSLKDQCMLSAISHTRQLPTLPYLAIIHKNQYSLQMIQYQVQVLPTSRHFLQKKLKSCDTSLFADTKPSIDFTFIFSSDVQTYYHNCFK